MEERRKRAVIADDEEDEEDVIVPVDGDVEEEEKEQSTEKVEEEEEAEDEDDGMGDLFGDDDDEEEKQIDGKPADDDGIVHDSNDEDEDEDQFLVQQEEVTRELRTGDEDLIRHPPKFDSKDGDIYTARIPKFLHVNPSRFDGTDHLKQLEQSSKSGLTKEEIELKRLQDENTIRWRFTKQSNESLTAESNAQIVEWEDGSFSLKLGDEYFDVLQSSLTDTYLVAREGDNQTTKPVIMVADGIIKKTMKFVPTSTNSKIHQKLTTAIRSRQQTKATTQSVVVDIDPTLEAKRLEKEQDERLREKRREQLRLEKDQERLGSVGPGSSLSQRDRHSTRDTYSRLQDEYENDDGFIDDDEDDDDVMEDVDEDVDEDEEEDEDDLAAERLKRVKEDGAAKYQEETEHSRKKRRVIDDDEDDE